MPSNVDAHAHIYEHFFFLELTSRTISKDLWSILKTFLFSTVMVAQAPLTTLLNTYSCRHRAVITLLSKYCTRYIIYRLSFLNLAAYLQSLILLRSSSGSRILLSTF
jgi:hypothetical protein